MKPTNGQLERERVNHAEETAGVSLIGNSPAIEEIRAAIDLVAESSTAVLISGESGTGKDVVANMIHNRSSRRVHPFVALNCAALPKDVIENELFGHELGAFTGALARKVGCFELAHGGTMFFDEIVEMPADTQAKLLRAIETKAFRRLGGKDEVKVDVRTIAATNRDIPTALKRKEFREDLYYRFSVIEILLPPLRDRREDIPLLVDHFLQRSSRQHGRAEAPVFSPTVMRMLCDYEWPGNIRELRNIVERCIVISQGDVIEPEVLPVRISAHRPLGSLISIPVGTTLGEAERRIITATLSGVGDNKSRAAKLLGISRRGLQKKMKRLGGAAEEATSSF
jgi:DNA-binding NtrC family response regulator